MHAKWAATRSLPIFYLAIIILFGLVTYLNTLYNDFVWDDHYLILENPSLRQPNVLKIFIQDIDNTGFTKTLFYRPLQNLSYIIDYRLWDFNPLGYHLTSILIHILNAILVFFLVDSIAGKKIISFLTALFFVAHPIHYGAVTYLSGRADSLFTLFFLVSFLAFVKYRKNPTRRVLLISTGGFILALLSKEMAIVTIVIFLLYDIIFNLFHPRGGTGVPPRGWNRLLLPYIGCGAVLFIYGAFRLSHLRQSLQAAFPGGGFIEHVITFPLVVAQHMSSLILPVDLCMRKSLYLAKSFWEPRVVAAFFMVALLVTLGFCLRNRKKEASFFIFFFLIALLPVSNIFAKINAIRADHWLYMPSMGFFFLAAYLLDSVFSGIFKGRFKNFLFSAGIILAAAYSAIAIRENTYWQDDVALFTEILRRQPDDPLTRGNLGMSYFARGRTEKALEEEKKLVELNPDYAEGYCNIGIIYFAMEKFGKARDYFKKAAAKDSSSSSPHLYLGLIYKGENRLPDAESEFRKFIELDPYSALGYAHMGIIKYDQNKFDESADFLAIAIKKNPASPAPYLYLSTIYRRSGENEKALRLLEKAARFNPDNVNILMDLGNTYNTFGLFDKAIACFKKALIISPEKSELYYNIANSYRLKNKKPAAKRYLSRALELNPSFKQASELLESLK